MYLPVVAQEGGMGLSSGYLTHTQSDVFYKVRSLQQIIFS